MNKLFMRIGGMVLFVSIADQACLAWDYEGHRLVNQLALASLPTNFPSFVRTPAAQERIAFLAGEPDRWRNTTDLPLKHFNAPDHFLDIEDLAPYQMEPTNLSHFRYEFTAQTGAARSAHPANFPTIDPARDTDHTRSLPGFLPWTITEYYAKVKSAFSYLKTFETDGTPEEIANAQQNVIYQMGVMGHFVGDGAQPLHMTRHYNGWVGNNPHGYTTNRTFHAWIDGGFFLKVGLRPKELLGKIRPAKMLWPGESKAIHADVFPETMTYLLDQFKLVEPLYQLDKEGKLSTESELGQHGRAFLEKQLIVAGQMLGDLWYSAWQQAPPDNYLKTQLYKRKLATETAPPKP